MSLILSDGKKRYNNYTLSILFSTLTGVAIIIPALLMHALSVGSLPEWLIDLVYAVFGISFVSRLVSGSSYVFSLLDRLTNEFTLLDFILPKSQKNKIRKTPEKTAKIVLSPKQIIVKTKNHLNAYLGQFVGNSLGFIFGTIFAVTTLILGAVSPTIINGVITSAFYLINHISNFSGWFNRLGRTVDYFRKDPKKNDPSRSRFCRKNVNYAIGVIFGTIVGAVLITVILCVAGITTPMSLGGAVPLWLSLGLLVIGTISSGASAGGYVGRCIDFFIGKRTVAHAIVDTVKNVPTKTWRERLNYEYAGTLIGVGIGITLAVVLIAAGVASLPFFGLGLPKLFAGMILLTACISQCGGLGNRLGQMLDKFFDTRKPKKKMQLDDTLSSDTAHLLSPPFAPGPASSCKVTIDATNKNDELVNMTCDIGKDDDSDSRPLIELSNSTHQDSVLDKTTKTHIVDTHQSQVTYEQELKEAILIPVKKSQLIDDAANFSAKNMAKMGIFGKSLVPRPSLPQIEVSELDKMHLHTFSAAAAA